MRNDSHREMNGGQKQMKKLKIAVIGCGGIAKNAHFPACQKMETDLVSVFARRHIAGSEAFYWLDDD